MTTKSKSKSKKNTAVPKKLESTPFDAAIASFRAATPSMTDRRKELLATVAGSIAAGMVTAPSPSISTPSSMATAAVDIAEEILKKAGLASDDSSAESASPSGDARVGAAS